MSRPAPSAEVQRTSASLAADSADTSGDEARVLLPDWRPGAKTLHAIEDKADLLISHLDSYLHAFDHPEGRDALFAGPSLYFHFRCCSLFHGRPVKEKLGEQCFLEYLYATLASWGMHRMGDTLTKLRDFRDFRETILQQCEELHQLDGRCLEEAGGQKEVVEKLAGIVEAMRVSASGSHLVANTKVLHHVLPDLVPPIDRRYTLAFFGISTNLPSERSAGSILKARLPPLARVAGRVPATARRRIDPSQQGWYTSLTKLIDNAIIGAGQRRPEGQGAEQPWIVG